MEASDVVVPSTADRLIVGGADFAIVSVMPVSPGGADLYYALQCRV